MRLYLDTNILVFLLGERSSLDNDVLEVLFDYSNTLYTSSVCVHELIHLFQIGKVFWKKTNGKPFEAADVPASLREMSVEVKAVTERHLAEYARLPLVRDHRDPFDRLIIAQAISDKATLVSSDLKFQWYERYGLRFVQNKR